MLRAKKAQKRERTRTARAGEHFGIFVTARRFLEESGPFAMTSACANVKTGRAEKARVNGVCYGSRLGHGARAEKTSRRAKSARGGLERPEIPHSRVIANGGQ